MQGFDEIKELKQLLDEGLITQEDFDRKKSELLSSVGNTSVAPPVGSPPAIEQGVADSQPKKKSKWVAGLAAIFLGGYGVHKFYLGYAAQGAILLAVTLGLALPATIVARALGIIPLVQLIGILKYIPVLIGVAEGVVYLAKSEDEFNRVYVEGTREWF